MSETRFTPGPWVVHDTIDGPVSNTDVRDRKNDFVARCGAMLGRPHAKEAEANARLIAAAPELFEVLQQIVSMQPRTDVQRHWFAKGAEALAKARWSGLEV